MRKGIVFTIDAVFAILIMLIMMTTVVTLIELQSQGDDSLKLSRLSRDVYENRFYDPGFSPPIWLLEGDKCSQARSVGSERAIVYAGSGQLSEVITKVCMNESA